LAAVTGAISGLTIPTASIYVNVAVGAATSYLSQAVNSVATGSREQDISPERLMTDALTSGIPDANSLKTIVGRAGNMVQSAVQDLFSAIFSSFNPSNSGPPRVAIGGRP
jgi:hypothetical protein